MTATTDRIAHINQRLSWHREQLLDLSARNSLLHFPLRDAKGKLKPKRLELHGLSPDDLFKALVYEGQSVVFRSDDDAPEEDPEDSDGLDLAPLPTRTVKHALDVAVPLTEIELQKRLVTLQRTSREFTEEQGIHCLYLAAGYLRWQDAKQEDQYTNVRLAPLLLIPVELRRAARSEPYRLVYTGDELQINFTLDLKLRELGLGLPPLPDTDEWLPSDYLARVREALQGHLTAASVTVDTDDFFSETPMTTGRTWSLDENVLSLGFFSFAKILMYHDLLPERWPDGVSAYEHPLLSPLLAGATSDERLPQDLSADEATNGRGNWLVLDADSSQAQAVHHVLQGRHLILQGPPGTGKSQTITNMIAGLISQGKKVLFVAEKEAALSVVQNRLKRVGLGHAVLALHSRSANKAQMRDALRDALHQDRKVTVPDQGEDDEIETLLSALDALPEAVNAPLNNLNLTPFDLMGRIQELRARLNGELRLTAPPVPRDLMTWTPARQAEAERLTEELGRWVGRLGYPTDLALWGSSKAEQLPQDRARLDSALHDLDLSLQALPETVQGLEDLTGAPLRRTADLTILAGVLDELLRAPELRGLDTTQSGWGALLPAFTSLQDTAERWQALQAAWNTTYTAPDGPWKRPVSWSMTSGQLRKALETEHSQRDIRTGLLRRVTPEALTADVASTRGVLSSQRGLFAIFSSAVRAARTQARQWIKTPGTLDEQLALLQEVEEYQTGERRLKLLHDQLPGWRFTADADPDAALSALNWLDAHKDLPHERPAMRAARQALGALLAAPGIPPAAGLDELLNAEDVLLNGERTHAGRLGTQAQGLNTPWTALRTAAAWLDEQQRTNPHWSMFVAALATQPELKRALQSQADRLRAEHDRLTERLSVLQEEAQLPDLRTQPFNDLHTLIQRVNQDPQALEHVVSWNQLSERLNAAGLQSLLHFFPAIPVGRAEALLLPSAQLVWTEALLEEAFRQRRDLARFELVGHTERRARFRRLDVDRLHLNRLRVRQAYVQTLPQASSYGQVGVLQKEFAKKKRLLPVRTLLLDAGEAVQAIKPVFMMSPLSIANLIPLGTLTFDVVIFDEASQVRPSDALGALLRADQAVIVGDLKQLGPTNFFAKASGEEDETEDAGLESLLALFEAQYVGYRRSLTWHYRSQHEALIETSNEAFYDGELITFPNAKPLDPDLGLRFHLLDPQQAYFETGGKAGGKRVNRGEAEAVVNAVIRHAQQKPRQSLAVVTFSASQQKLIEGLIDQRVATLPEAHQAFFSEDRPERFVVKNLENVQGDERDVIMISVGYGYSGEKGKDIKFVQRFGPLGNADGWRRLNVLITRARLRIEVFTNFKPDQLSNLNETESHRGLRAFRQFLERCLHASQPSQLEERSMTGLTGQVAQVLRQAGYTVHDHVGSSASRIELAVAHPERPGEYVLGVELDGPEYHSAQSVRDRDRLREEVLQTFGWRAYRIWSVDWFRHPERAAQDLVAAAQFAHLNADQALTMSEEGEPQTLNVEEDFGDFFNELPSTATVPVDMDTGLPDADPYVEAQVIVRTYGQPFHQVPTSDLSAALADVVRQEGPIARDLAMRRLMQAIGISKAGHLVQSAFALAADHALHSGTVTEVQPGFLISNAAQLTLARNHGSQASKNALSNVCDAELQEAMKRVAAHALGITAEDLTRAALTLLGISTKITAPIQARARQVLMDGVGRGIFQIKGNAVLPL